MTTTIGEYPPDLPLTELCLALRDVTASVAALDLDDATLWAAADSIVAQVIAEVYAVTAQLAGNPQNRPAVAVSPVVRVRELAVCQRRLAAHLDRLDQLNLKLGQVRPTARRSIERIDQLNKQLRALG